MGRCTILLLPEVLDALVQMLLLPRRDDDVEDVVKEQALMCLGNLSVDGMFCTYLGKPIEEL